MKTSDDDDAEDDNADANMTYLVRMERELTRITEDSNNALTVPQYGRAWD